MVRPLKIFLGGATGRMGRAVGALAETDRRFAVAGGLCRKKTAPFVTIGEVSKALKKADIIVDFSLPGASLALMRAAAEARIPMVTGTTGFSKAQHAAIVKLARQIPILASPNMSPGMNVLFALTRAAAAALPDYDAAVFEIHHTRKKDAPSGSALGLVRSLGRGRAPAASLRIGTVVGEHTVHLAGPDERVELTHRAQDRSVFARGALEAALWLGRRRRPGLHTMADALGL